MKILANKSDSEKIALEAGRLNNEVIELRVKCDMQDKMIMYLKGIISEYQVCNRENIRLIGNILNINVGLEDQCQEEINESNK